MGENHVAAVPSALDGGVLLRAAIASWVLQRALIAAKGARSVLGAAVGGDRKGRLSPVLHLPPIASTLRTGRLAQALYVLATPLGLVPDRRIEHALQRRRG